MAGVFPIDISDAIIDILAEDKATLRACALVNHNFAARARCACTTIISTRLKLIRH